MVAARRRKGGHMFFPFPTPMARVGERATRWNKPGTDYALSLAARRAGASIDEIGKHFVFERFKERSIAEEERVSRPPYVFWESASTD